MGNMTTGIIRYNLKDRMRQFNGEERNFNIPQLVSSINSNKLQERVKLGDLHGFYGHWARLKFGAEPQEGGIVDGKIINLEPCFRTTYLKAYDDGTVEHQAEFFDNEPGRKAFALLQSKAGGFSSVISRQNGETFHGFDVVREPNYSGNRPYALDSAEEDPITEVLVLDDVGENIHSRLQSDYIDYLLDSIAQLNADKAQLLQENRQIAESLQQLHADNDLLLDDILILRDVNHQKQQEQRFDETKLDSVIAQAAQFNQAKLESIDMPENESDRTHREINRQLSRFIG